MVLTVDFVLMSALTVAIATDIAKQLDAIGTTAPDGQDTALGDTSVLRPVVPTAKHTPFATLKMAAGTTAV